MGWVILYTKHILPPVHDKDVQITQPFELCIALSPRLPKAAAVGAANAVARWVKKEESRLFLRDAPVF